MKIKQRTEVTITTSETTVVQISDGGPRIRCRVCDRDAVVLTALQTAKALGLTESELQDAGHHKLLHSIFVGESLTYCGAAVAEILAEKGSSIL